jgi:hypothetical protein
MTLDDIKAAVERAHSAVTNVTRTHANEHPEVKRLATATAELSAAVVDLVKHLGEHLGEHSKSDGG